MTNDGLADFIDQLADLTEPLYRDRRTWGDLREDVRWVRRDLQRDVEWILRGTFKRQTVERRAVGDDDTVALEQVLMLHGLLAEAVCERVLNREYDRL